MTIVPVGGASTLGRDALVGGVCVAPVVCGMGPTAGVLLGVGLGLTIGGSLLLTALSGLLLSTRFVATDRAAGPRPTRREKVLSLGPLNFLGAW